MTDKPTNPASEAARALRAIPSEKRSQASRENGRRGGRPTKAERAHRRIDDWFTAAELEFIWADWPNMDEHVAWLLKAGRVEIADWIAASR